MTYAYENIGTKLIWALVRVWADYCNGFRARDSQGSNRRCGLTPTMLGDNWDEDALDLTDTELLRLEPGQTISRSYTLCVSEKVDGFIPSDMYKLEVGKRYILGLLPRRWRWIYAEDLPEDVDEDCGLVDFLNRRDVAQWKPDCTAVFEVVE